MKFGLKCNNKDNFIQLGYFWHIAAKLSKAVKAFKLFATLHFFWAYAERKRFIEEKTTSHALF